jgi:hypothetical protein
MQYFLENLYKSNMYPIDDNIKFNIYTQYYKRSASIPEALKKDIHTYGMINYVIECYKNHIPDQHEQEYFLYDLYNDLVHQHHINDKNYIHHDALVANHYINTVVMDTFHNRSSYVYYPFVMGRIKYFWRLLNYTQRLHFVYSMRTRFNLK